VKFTNILY